MPVHTSSYRQGMDRDSSRNKYQADSYYLMKNMRLTSFDELSNGTVQSVKGNVIYISKPEGYDDYIIIGFCIIRNYFVVWATDDNTDDGGNGSIFRCNLSESTPSWTLVYESSEMNLTTRHPIQKEAIGYYESEDIVKVYWTDFHNMIRFINILDDNSTMNVDKLNILSIVNMSSPELVNIGVGSLYVGKVQYSYQYYDIGGTETVFSPCTPVIHLTKSSEQLSGAFVRNYIGCDSFDSAGNPEVSGKSVTIQINNADTRYDRVRVVAIHYRNLDEEPDIHIVGEYDLEEAIQIIDFGVYSKGTLTLNAFRTLGNHELYCKTISQKGNKALIGDIKEKFFDLDFDARVYRYGPIEGADLEKAVELYFDDHTTDLDKTTSTNSMLVFYPTTPASILAYTNVEQGLTGLVTGIRVEYSETIGSGVAATSNVGTAIEGNSNYTLTLTYLDDTSFRVHISNFQRFAELELGVSDTRHITGSVDVFGTISVHLEYQSSITPPGYVTTDDITTTTLPLYNHVLDTFEFDVVCSSGDYFVNFSYFSYGQTYLEFRILYDYDEVILHYYQTSNSSLLHYNPTSIGIVDPATWEFEVTPVSGLFFPLVGTFNANNITETVIYINTYFTYSGVSDKRIIVYNSVENIEEQIHHDVNENAWPNTTYRLYNGDTGEYELVPEDHDCINPYNFDFLYGANLTTPNIVPQIDEVASYCDVADFAINSLTNEANNANQFKWQSDLTTIGGEGPNIKYEFVYDEMYINESADTRYTQADRVQINDLNSFDSHCNPFRTAYLMDYKHDEVYRHGLVATNNKGQDSFVKWIGDIKTPTISERPISSPVAYLIIAHTTVNTPYTIEVTNLTGDLNAKIVNVSQADAFNVQSDYVYMQGFSGTATLTVTEGGITWFTGTITFADDHSTTASNFQTTYNVAFTAGGYILLNATQPHNKVYPLGIRFTVNTTPLYEQGAVGFRIVRVERKKQDRSIYSQGIVSNMFLSSGGASTAEVYRFNNRLVGFTRATVKTPTEGTRATYFVREPKVVQFISPDVNFFKELNPSTNDYIKVQAKLTSRRTNLIRNIDVNTYIDVAGTSERTEIIGIGDTYSGNFGEYGWMNYSRYLETAPLNELSKYNILDGILAGQVEYFGIHNNLINFPSTPGGYGIVNRSVDVNSSGDYEREHEGISGTCAILVLEDDLDVSELTSTDEHEIFLVDYKRNGNAASQYGGLTYVARQNNEYIECSPYYSITETTGNADYDVYGGDCFIDFFNHIRTMWEQQDLDGSNWYDISPSQSYFSYLAIPVESHINLGLQHGAIYDRYYENPRIYALREDAGTYDANTIFTGVDSTRMYLEQQENHYLYNPVFSQQNKGKVYFCKPHNWQDEYHDDTLVKISLEKYPREEIDSYLKFLTDNERLLPTDYGSINDLFLFKNYMIVFMDHAIGTLSIDERALLPIQNNSILELGAADNLKNFDFIANRSGSVHPESIEYCEDGFVWYDAFKGMLGYYNGQTQDIGLVKGMSSPLKAFSDGIKKSDGTYYDNQFWGGNIIAAENKQYKETLLGFIRSSMTLCSGKYTTYNTVIKYGALYNWYATTDVREIANTGWHVPTDAEWAVLHTFLGGQVVAGGKMKETGTTYWNAPNTGATNEVDFNGRGSGSRNPLTGVFATIKASLWMWCGDTNKEYDAQYDSIILFSGAGVSEKQGYAIRLIKDSTILTHGQTGIYIGNDNKVYSTICIGTQEWIAHNLSETQFRNGDSIPYVSDNTIWSGLSTAGMCYYDNDISNAYEEINPVNALEFTFNLGQSPGNYSDAYIAIDGDEYIAHSIDETNLVINNLDNPSLDIEDAKWLEGKEYFIYFKDISTVYSFSSIINGFMFELDIFPTHLIKYNDDLFNVIGKFEIQKENVGNYGYFNGSYRKGVIEYVINPMQSAICLFNNYEYNMEVYDSNNNNITAETWTTMRFFNDYQFSASDGDTCTFETGSNVVGTSGIAHGLITGDKVMFSGSLPAEVDNETLYYVINPASAQFQITETMNGTPIVFSSDTTSLYHKYDIPVVITGNDYDAKRRIRTWRITDPRDMKGYVSGVFKPRMRDSYIRIRFSYQHGSNKKIIMHDLNTFYTVTRESMSKF